MPLHRACTEILGVLLKIDPWKSGPSLEDMGLKGAPVEVMKRVRG